MWRSWLLLGIAVMAEVTATSALKMSDGFTRGWAVVVLVIGYGLAFYLMSIIVRVLPVGVVYAVWSGFGIVLITLVGWLHFGQRLNIPTLVGMALIIGGVVVLQAFAPHAVAVR
ncbi:MAG TPA: multidrug efflux SMR transporter [Nevskiaceae bacterium]